MLPSTVRLFSCTICNELLGESSCSTFCGHLFHFNCIQEWSHRSDISTCPNCRSDVKVVFMVHPSKNERFEIKSKEELESLDKQLNVAVQCNESYMLEVDDLTSKLNTSEDILKKYHTTIDNITNDLYSNHLSSCHKTIIDLRKEISVDYKLNQERSKMILMQKEAYEYQAMNSVELKKLISEIEKLKEENASFKSRRHGYTRPSTSSKNARRKNALPRQLRSSKLRSSSDNLLSNCHFWIVDELRKAPEATNHLYFNEHRIVEHGGTVAYNYTNMVTHVIGTSQKSLEVIRGINERKKCVTDYWLSDVIAEKKIIKPWLAHHFPIPFSEDNLPHKNKEIAIVNFDILSEYYKIKAMVEVTGAIVTNKISRNTYIVISLKLEGEMIQRASSLNIPVVNMQWINDIVLGEEVNIQHFKEDKYQRFNSPNPYMNYAKVLHLMEAWNGRRIAPKLKTNKKIKTCAIKEYNIPSDDNNSDENNITSITSILAISNTTEPRIMSSEPKLAKKEN